MSVYQDGKEGISAGGDVTINLHECSVKGGERIILSFSSPLPPDAEMLLVLRGSNGRQEVVLERNGPTVLYATVPAHRVAEAVDLLVCYRDDSGEQRTLYQTQFAYTVDEKQFMAELLVQSVSESGVPLQYSLLPPLPTADALREFDCSLTEALQDTELPTGWTLVGYGLKPLMSIDDFSPRETLLHFAARHSFNSLARHLLTLPGAEVAALLPNDKGEEPLSLARTEGNEGLVQLLTMFNNQVRSPSVIDSPVHCLANGAPEPCADPPGEGEEGGDCEAMPWERGGAVGDIVGRKRNREELQKINDEWKLQVKRHKPSTSSIGHIHPLDHTVNGRNCVPSPPIPNGRSDPPRRRSSVAIMDSTNHPHLGRATPIGSVKFNVNNPVVAEMDRLRKVSWSRVVGSCKSRSVGTGLNELDRITAEDTLQEKVDAEQELHKEKATPSQYSLPTLNQDQLNLLYRLSTSCPALNQDKESVSYSRALSATTSPRFCSPFSEGDDEMEDDGQSSDLIESCSPQPPYQLLEPSFSARSESSFSRTNTDSSTSSRVQKSLPIPEVITTDYTALSQGGAATDVSPGASQRLEDNRQPRTESEATLVVVQRNGNSNNSEGVDGGSGVSDAENEVTISWVPVTKSLSSSLIKLSEELGGAPEGEGDDDGGDGAELKVEGGVTASASAPDLLALTQEEKAESNLSPVAESITVPGTEGSDRAALSSGGEAAENLSEHTVRDSTERELSTSFESSRTEESELQDGEGTVAEPQSPSTPTAQVTPRRGTSHRNISSALHKKRHRRSLSTSEVEVSSPKDHAHFPLDGSDEEEERPESRGRGYSNWEMSLTCMQNVIAEVNQSLTIEQAASIASGCSSQRGTDAGDRSRASSFLTNETSSQRESDGSSDEDLYLSAKESISRTSLEQAMAPLNDVAGTKQPDVRENGSSSVDEKTTLKGNGSGHQQLQLPNEEYDGVILRSGSKKRTPRMGSSLNRYSADFQITNIDEFGESSEGESNHHCGRSSPPKRRHKSTDVISETHSEDHRVSSGKPPSGNSSGSPSLAQDQLHPRSAQMMSTFGADSVFEHDLSPSDVDVRMTSDDSISLSQSFESTGLLRSPGSVSVESGGGSPKEFAKRRKSPHFLSGRKLAVSTLESPPRNRKAGGLTKEDVGPTIQTLRGLMTSPTNPSWSDDSDTTIGPDTFLRIGSPNAPKTNLQRSGSTLSDSLVYQQQRAQLNDTGRGILRSASPEGSGDYTSLDSPLSSRKFQPHLVDTPKHPPSPLYQSHTRSPVLGSRNTTPSPGHSPSPGSRPGPAAAAAISRLRSTTSFDESVLQHHEPWRHTGRVHASSDTANLENQETLEEVPEEELESSLDSRARKSENGFPDEPHASEEGLVGEQPSQEQRSRMQKIFGIRGSGRSKKPPKDKTVRPKLGKQRLRLEGNSLGEEEIVFVQPEDYHQPSSSNLKRSESMQTNFGKNRALIAPRQGSDGAISPKKHHGSTHSLTPLMEVPSSPPLRVPSQQELHPTSDSEMAADEEEIPTLVTAVSYPELALCEEQTWDKTVDRRIYKKLNKAERERQAIIHELLQTEKSHLRALNVLKLIFRLNIMKTVSDEVVVQLFPELDNLLEISEGFIKRLEERKDSSRQVNIFGDISDVLLKQFSGDMKERMLHAFGEFCSAHLMATEIYKEHLKKKHFSRLMKGLHILKECNRLTLPDYYTQVSQRLAKLVTLHRRLVRKTEALKLEHAPQMRESMDNLQELVAAVDQTVEDHKNQMELLDIQGKLEISVPKSAKGCNRKEIKGLSLVAQERKLRKTGEAEWKGHGRHLSVHVVLVTDLLVFLTERDQKYHLAALQDLKPPVIRLYDLHVRLNAAVKSGVQLLLLEQGEFPEMFRLEFQSKKEAKGWEATLNSAVEECKEKGLKCEFFGVERVVSGDEERRSEEKEGDSEGEGEEQGTKGDKKNQKSPSPNRSPSLRRWQRARESLDLAVRLLGVSSLTADADAAQRHTTAAGAPFRYVKESPRNKRALTIALRPKTVYDDTDGAAATGDHGSGGKAAKVKGQKKKVERSKTFRDKEKDKDKVEKGGGAGEGGGGWRIPEQQYVECITTLKDSLEHMVNDYEQQNKLIARLQKEVESLKESQKVAKREAEGSVPQHPSRNSSPRGSPQQRPRSCHIELSDEHPGGEEEEGGVAKKENENKTSDTGT